MIYPDTPPDEWRKKHKLPVKFDTCAKCEKEFELSVPIMMQGCVGLSTPVHECGEGFTSTILTPYSDKAKSFWKRVMGL